MASRQQARAWQPEWMASGDKDARVRAPVGVFDSGVGGLTVLREMLRDLPDERFLYFGDTGNCPYGPRGKEEIVALSLAAGRFLLEHGAKIIVVACNTASVWARDELRAQLGNPAGVEVVAVVPPVKPAARGTRKRVIGLVATEAAARGRHVEELIAEFATGMTVYKRGCPALVRLVESGVLEGPEAEAAVRAEIGPMLQRGIDVLVLGCTHFPALRSVFERVAGPEVEVIDSGAAIAQRVRFLLTRAGLLAPPGSAASEPRAPRTCDTFWSSGDAAHFSGVASAILGYPVTAQHVAGMLLERAEPPERAE
jgi:glutamate racemase